jgi:hypothetical protein
MTLGDLKLALRDLVDERGEELRLSATGKMYEPRLRAKKKEIEAIPDAAGSNAPFARELGETDVRHDGFGAAIFYLAKAVEAHPTLAASLKEAAATVRKSFVPELDILRAPYADEASAALDNRPELEKLKQELKSITVPGGSTLHAWVKSFVDAGDEIDALLRKRAELLATGENAAATGPLRGATIGLLGRFREALRDEIQEEGSKLPADHEARLFSYVDKLNADRERAVRARATPEENRENASPEQPTTPSSAKAPAAPPDK